VDIRVKLQNSLIAQDGTHPRWEIPYTELSFGKKLGILSSLALIGDSLLILFNLLI
jgi:hypothetical protein